MFQAKLKGWKRLAAGLVLLPGFAAFSGDVFSFLGTAQAQERSVDPAKVEQAKKMMADARAAYNKGDYAKAQDLAEKVKAMKVGEPFWEDSPDNLLADIKNKTGGTMVKKSTAYEDPRILLKKANRELERGNFDKAQDLARRAEANGRNADWGLFEDTPSSVLKDIQKARSKHDQAEADKLMTKARGLFEQRASTDEVRAVNLDKARGMALDAARLHGPYGMFDFGDKPQSLIKEIDQARAKIKIAVRKSPPKDPKVVAKDSGPMGSPFSSTGPNIGDPDKSRPGSLLKPEPPLMGGATISQTSTPKTASQAMEGLILPPTPKPIGAPSTVGASNADSANSPYGTAKSTADSPGGSSSYGTARTTTDSAGSSPYGTANTTAGSQTGSSPYGTGNTVGGSPNDLGNSPYNQGNDVAMPVNPHGHGNLRKDQAIQMMVQARSYETSGKLVEARELYQLAQKQNANFGPGEETPEMALQSLNLKAVKHIGKLCGEAYNLMASHKPADVTEAETKLNEAETIGLQLGLDRSAITELRGSLRIAKGQTQPMRPPTVVTPVGASESDIPPAVVISNPAVPNRSVAPVVGVGIPNDPKTKSLDPRYNRSTDQGAEMLRQAHVELRAGQIENARRITEQVLSGPYEHKDEAQDFLRTLAAEELDLKKGTARRSYEHAVIAYQQRNYEQALGIFKLIDPVLLSPQQRSSMSQLLANASKAVDASASGLVRAGGQGSLQQLPPVSDGRGENSLLKQQEAMAELRFQKLRGRGLEIEAAATARFGKGETDAALADLNNFIAEVKSASLEKAKENLLIRPVENRIERLKLLKHNQDFLAKEAKGLKDFRTQQTQTALQTEYKKEQVVQMMKDFKTYMDEGKFDEANMLAMKMRELDPDDPSVTAAAQISHMWIRKKKWQDGRDENERTTFEGINDAMKLGHHADIHDPIHFDKEHFDKIRNRPNYNSGILQLRPQTDIEKKIESELKTKMVSFNFKTTPLDEVVNYLQTYTGINFDLDSPALKADGIDSREPITQKLDNIPLNSALTIVLNKAKLRFVIDNNVVKITTARGAKGKLTRRTLPVADLVIPVQNYYPPAIADLDAVMTHNMQYNFPRLPGSATTPFTPLRGLPNMAATPIGTPTYGGRLMNTPAGPNGTIQNEPRPPGSTIEETLIRLITNSVQPDSWDAMGGSGRIEYYPLGMALVINQTPDVIEEVIRLLESLRQLQDLEVAIEVRMITLAESFYERMGLDFSMNLNTNNNKTLVNLVNNNGLFNNFTNLQNSGVGRVIGLAAPGVPTPDLNVPINATSFGPAIPPFGGFPNAPGADGGVSLGLAFLSEVQVQLFLEAAQGDRRTNVMQAPKLTMFNGQSASLRVQDQQYFLTSITVTSVNGQLVFTPNNTPFPLGVFMNMQPVVSGDRRFVRLNIQQTMTNLASANVPLFPITTIVTPVFDGGAQGQPVPFTQYIQQPLFTTISVSTTVVVPDGGTVLLGGLKTLSEGRNEFGPPVISKIPYINRLFRNIGYGRDVSTLMMMVTPRIIINREEQERQTGVIDAPLDIN